MTNHPAVQHKLSAYFSSDGEKYMPVMDCTCGYDTGRCDNFESAGFLVDEHLAEVRMKDGVTG